jgi:peptidylprolyl isomerase
MQIAVVLAVVVVIIFVALGFFGIGRAPATAEPAATGPQDLLNQISASGGVSTLQKYQTVAGTGAGAKPGDTVTVHYTGALPDGTVFDSSRTRGEPYPVTIGVTPVIQGWQQGLVGATKGERFILAIPPALGYGERGQGPIPPNASLIFDIEILDIAFAPAS